MPRWWQAASCQTCHPAYLERWNTVFVVYTNHSLQPASLAVGWDRYCKWTQSRCISELLRSCRGGERGREGGSNILFLLYAVLLRNPNMQKTPEQCSHFPGSISTCFFSRTSNLHCRFNWCCAHLPCNGSVFTWALSATNFIFNILVQLHWLCTGVQALSNTSEYATLGLLWLYSHTDRVWHYCVCYMTGAEEVYVKTVLTGRLTEKVRMTLWQQ